MDRVVQVNQGDVGLGRENGRKSLGDDSASQPQHDQTDCNCASHSPGFRTRRAAEEDIRPSQTLRYV